MNGGSAMSIDVHGLTKRYRDHLAVDDISCPVPDAAVFAFVGTNGAGKSTTIGCLTTALPFEAGTVRVRGHDVVREGEKVRELIGVVFQESLLDPLLTARENLRLRARFAHMPRPRIDARIAEISALIGLDDFLRSEEHTSELQSLMRISYAVFCLKNKHRQE